VLTVASAIFNLGLVHPKVPLLAAFLPESFQTAMASEVYLYKLETPYPLAIFICLMWYVFI
jgi:hypothetical protein